MKNNFSYNVSTYNIYKLINKEKIMQSKGQKLVF